MITEMMKKSASTQTLEAFDFLHPMKGYKNVTEVHDMA
jgi:hypothetical protein